MATVLPISQGTVRGRNALGGTVNIVSKKPEMNKFDGYAQVGVGNYDEKEYRGALNLTRGPRSSYSIRREPTECACK